MLMIFLILQMIFAGLTLLTTQMLENKFSKIHKSLDLYHNKRSYKTLTDIDFINDVMNDYKILCNETNSQPDLEKAVRVRLQKEYVGRFKYMSVKNTAMKIRYLMLVISLATILTARIEIFLSDLQILIAVGTTFLLAIIMYIYGTIHNLETQQNQLVDSIIDYVKNVHPIEQLKEHKRQENIKEEQRQKVEREKQEEEERKLIEFNLKQEEQEKIKEQQKKSQQGVEDAVKASGLTAHDISQILNNL